MVRASNKKYHRKASIKLKVDGELWHQVPGLNDSKGDDKHYTVRAGDDGVAVIIFGDGKQGRRPPGGRSNIKVTFSPNRHFSGVLLQQGRLQLDDDWNENNAGRGRFCGIYRGVVMDNVDPHSHMRLLVQVPEVLGTEEAWALPCIPVGTSVAAAIGERVWIMFENGASANPVYMGTWPGIE